MKSKECLQVMFYIYFARITSILDLFCRLWYILMRKFIILLLVVRTVGANVPMSSVSLTRTFILELFDSMHAIGESYDTLLLRNCFLAAVVLSDRLCGLVVRVLGYTSGGPGSIPGTARKKKLWVWNGVHSASLSTTEELLDRKVAAPI
jgi:hypothetical protein